MDAVRIGIVGLGAHGLRYAAHLAAGDVPGARLALVCRRDRGPGEAAARRLGVGFTPDYRQVLSAPDVDAVVFAVPCDLHTTMVPEALAAEKAVLVEKPLAPDAAGAAAIVEAGRRCARPAMVAQTLRFNTVVRAMRERREALGAIRFVALSQRFEPSDRTWLDLPGPGGILRNTGVHSFDLARHVAGVEVEEVSCFAQQVVTRITEDSFSAILRLQNGALGAVDNDRVTASRNGRIELVGEHGQLVGDHVHHQLAEIRGTRSQAIALPPPVPTVRECLAAFTASVREGAPLPIPLEEGLRAVEIVEACRLSAQTGLPQRVERHVF